MRGKLEPQSSFSKLWQHFWRRSEPYRLGFLLGSLAVAATATLILTGAKSQRLLIKTQNSVAPVLEQAEASDSTPVASQSSARQVEPRVSSHRITSGKVSLNQATLTELESLPYIGPITAQRILDYRAAYGPFKRIEDLDQVKGIGPKTIERIRNRITL